MAISSSSSSAAPPQIPPLEQPSSPILLQRTLAAIMPADFDKQSYWRKRFASERAFEWLVKSADFMPLVEPVLQRLDPATARILHIGFGTSDLQNHFRARGFRSLLNVDYEPLAVDRGRELETQAFGDVQMRYQVHDATQLNLKEEEFDLVVDKSTADAISCAGETSLRRMAAGVRNCLADGGAWVSLSYSSSRFDLDDLPFDVEVLAKVPMPKLLPHDPDLYHWCYLLRPKRDTPFNSPVAMDDNPAGEG